MFLPFWFVGGCGLLLLKSATNPFLFDDFKDGLDCVGILLEAAWIDDHSGEKRKRKKKRRREVSRAVRRSVPGKDQSSARERRRRSECQTYSYIQQKNQPSLHVVERCNARKPTVQRVELSHLDGLAWSLGPPTRHCAD